MIEVVNLTQHYGVRPVLRGVNLRFGRGELAVVVGPNGMGKSTLLAAIAGVLAPQAGHVAIDGKRRRSSAEDELAVRRVTAYLPDRAWLPAVRSPREFLLGVGRLYQRPDDRLFDEVDRLLGLFDLVEKSDAPIRGCSAGQQKKIALCGALIAGTPVLLLDEPFSGGLDPAGILVLKRLLQRRATDGGTVVLTSPVPEIVDEIATRVVLLRGGVVVADDTPDGLRRLAGTEGPFAAALERLLYPDTLRKLDDYLNEGRP
jgi:ABC-type multidrug transport system ATPase subunit